MLRTRRVGAKGLWSSLYAVTSVSMSRKRYVQEFVQVVREKCAASLEGITLL